MMRMISSFRTAAIAAAALVMAAVPAAATTIVVVDSNELWNETKAGKDVQRQLREFRDSLDTQLKTAGEELKTEATELKKQKEDEKIKEAQFNEKARELAQKEMQLRGGVQQRQRLLQVATRNAQAQFYEAIRPVLLEVMESKKGDILIEKGQVLHAADSVEITSAAISKIEQKVTKLEVVLIPQVEEGEAEGPAPNKKKN